MKAFKRIIKLISVFSMAAVCALLCASCSKSPDLEDILPDKFGEPEGFYIYNGNTRSLTDGSNNESVLKSVVIGGIEYGEEYFSIKDYAYASSAHKVFFYLSVNKKSYLYRYDYQSKSGEQIECAEGFEFYKSSSYVYIKDESTKSGCIYSLADGELACGDFYGKLNGDVVYDLGKVYDYDKGVWHDKLIWFKDGKISESIYGENRFDMRYFYRIVDCFYFLTNSSDMPSCSVNLNDGSVSDLTSEESEACKNQAQNHEEASGRKYTKELNGYSFYVDFKTYNRYQYAGYLPIPIPTDEKCWFMYRVHGGKTEVIQYSTETSKFYDDIREF